MSRVPAFFRWRRRGTRLVAEPHVCVGAQLVGRGQYNQAEVFGSFFVAGCGFMRSRSTVAKSDSSVRGSCMRVGSRGEGVRWSFGVAAQGLSSGALTLWDPLIPPNSTQARVRTCSRRARLRLTGRRRFSTAQQTPPVAFLVFLGFVLGAAFFGPGAFFGGASSWPLASTLLVLGSDGANPVHAEG